MKNTFKGIAITFGIVFVLLVLYAFTSAGTLFIQSYIYPQWLSVQRSSVESSKSYTDSKNTALMNLSTQYSALDVEIEKVKDNSSAVSVYKAQQKAIKNQICQMISTMKQGTVSPMISQFLSQNGGCY